MENGMMTVWFPHVVDKATGELLWGPGYFASRWDAEDRAWEFESNARRKGNHDVAVKVVTRQVPEGEGRFWISTNRF